MCGCFDENYTWASNVAKSLIHKLSLHGNDRADAYQCALVAFWMQCQKHDPSIGNVRTFAYQRMRGAILDMQRKNFVVGSRRVHVRVGRDGVLRKVGIQHDGFAMVDAVDSVEKINRLRLSGA